jgi:hypothetical protein
VAAHWHRGFVRRAGNAYTPLAAGGGGGDRKVGMDGKVMLTPPCIIHLYGEPIVKYTGPR